MKWHDSTNLFRQLLGYLHPYRGRALVATGLIITASLLQLAGPVITAYAVDHYLLPSDGIQRDLTGFSLLILLYIFISVVTSGVLHIQTRVMEGTGQRVMVDLRAELYRHLTHMDQNFIHRHPVGRLMTRVMSDVDTLNELFTSGFVSIFGDFFLLAGIIAAMLIFNWKLALATFSILPFLILLSVWFQRTVLAAYREVRRSISALNAYLQERLSGITVIQLFQQERRTMDTFQDLNQNLMDANIRSITSYSIFFPGVEFLSSVGLAIIVWVGGGQVLEQSLTFGTLLAFIQYTRRFYEPLNDLAEKFNVLQSARAAGERVFDLLQTAPDLVNIGTHIPENLTGEIRIQRVSFAYDREPVLKGLDLTIPAGQKVAVVGPTGAGKSSFIALLKRFYDPTEGIITLDGVSLAEYDLPSLRKVIAEVQQDVTLFQGSILENLRMFDSEITLSSIEAMIQDLGFSEWFSDLPDGLQTELGASNTTLSLGQQQIISVVRAMVQKPSLLILDEATASVDSILEQKIQSAVERLMEGKTTVVIAHRLSTLRGCDRILVFLGGRLVEDGTHRELLSRNGMYTRLYQLLQA
ncbi:MAG TPA: ABC transporter ATP-binding protein [Thermoanaerobaculia bacterium]|nr:ABC transporter ATP-binding protein [Thermoanaerobaculia bacterium]HUM28737.1 ABC transporter ATP-binding protein [Thermoanaerobaculia bacterium]HXK68013.1 ABC transporter ATP-binding protein [Thermoanaerobaculia bacterium]